MYSVAFFIFISHSLCISIVDNLPFQIFLNPLHDLLGDDYGRDPIPSRILRACTSTAEKSLLHSLGTVLAIKEWKEDFKEFCFISRKHGKKTAYFKNVMREKMKESASNKPVEIHCSEINEEVHDKEPNEQSFKREEVISKVATLEEFADDSKQEPDNFIEEENFGGMCSHYAMKKKSNIFIDCDLNHNTKLNFE